MLLGRPGVLLGDSSGLVSNFLPVLTKVFCEVHMGGSGFEKCCFEN